MKYKRIIFFLLSLFILSKAQIMFKKPLSERVVQYKIDVKLDDENKKIFANENIVWKNLTKQSTNQLQFHLYLNAFKNTKSTFNKESSGRHRGSVFIPNSSGWTKIKKLEISGKDYLDQIQFITPDDDNLDDSTVIKIDLGEKIKPGQSLNIYLEFEAQLPKIYARTGYKKDFFMLGQWFPKLGVLEEKGWNCHQFHVNSEFYADFGTYDVNITVPNKYVVGATGIILDTLKSDSTVTLKYRAEDVHDFAWTASPKYLKETRVIRDVEVELLFQPEHAGMVERYYQSIDYALKYFGEWYMKYPYPKMTMVDPPLAVMGAGGMEYPMFITCGSIWGISDKIRMMPEIVTIHEFGHNYFYGIIASNEFEEAWLDEGMNTYTENKISAKVWGEWSTVMGFENAQNGDYANAHSSLIKKQRHGVIYTKSWEYTSRSDYGFNSYGKSSLLLITLEKYLGAATMQKIWKEYFKRFSFKHPKTEDFIKTVTDVSKQDMSWFFNQYLYKDAIVDYKVRKVASNRIHPKDSLDLRKYRNRIYLNRNSDGIFPVEAQIVFSTKDTMSVKWDGKKTNKMFEIFHEGKVIEVKIDPYMKNYLDINWKNNSWRKKSNTTWAKYLENKYIYLVQNLFLFLTN